jgi:DMSO/TMAO reductase YedYZ heme-binding membrane subunit
VNGWRVFWLLAVVTTTAFVVSIQTFGTEESGIRALVRVTARASFAIFVPVYLASPLRRLWPSATTRWALRNRRYLGVSFAWAHGLHLLAIVMLALLLGDAFESEVPTIVVGGAAYLLMFGMAATSFDRSARWLGPQRWKLLHRSGLHLLWLVFAISFSGRATTSSLYLTLAILVWGMAGVRAAAHLTRRAASPHPAAS